LFALLQDLLRIGGGLSEICQLKIALRHPRIATAASNKGPVRPIYIGFE